MRRTLGILFLAAMAHGLIYAAVIPPWQGPDEIAHYEYSRLLAALRRPLTFRDASPELEGAILQSMVEHQAWTFIGRETPEQIPERLREAPFFGRSRTLSRFSLAYVLYAAAALPLLDQPVTWQLYAMRLVSVVQGALVVLLAYQTGRVAAPEIAGLAAGAAGFVLLLPQHAFITATVNDGNLAELLASGVIYLLVRMARDGLTWPRAGLCLAGVLGAILTKATAYYLIPLVILAGLILAIRKPGGKRWQPDWRSGMIATGVILLVCLSLAVAARVSPSLDYIVKQLSHSLESVRDLGIYPADLDPQGRLSLALWGTFKSFWVMLGWMSLPLPTIWYAPLMVAFGLALAGMALRWRDLRGNRAAWPGYAIIGLGAALPEAVLLAWFVGSPNGLYYYQGRYLFGGIIPIAMVLAGGWLRLAPGGRANLALGIMLVGMAVLDAAALFGLAVPFYYG